MCLCCPALKPTQDKTTKAEEEVDLLEEQSRDYKDRLDKALKQIENLSAKKLGAGKAGQKSQPSASDNKGKRKALPDDDSGGIVEDASDKTTKPKKTTKAQKRQTTAKESQPADVDVEIDTEDAAAPKKKKMRKLNVNIFASAKPDSLDWANQFNLVSCIAVRILLYDCDTDAIIQGDGALDIPTALSPVKVPARSLARSSVSVPFRKG